MGNFFWFSDEQWAGIEPLLPQDTRGMPRVDDRRVLSGIVHALKSGGRWSDCPEHIYGPKKTLYNRFRRWAERGVWERIFSSLAGVEGLPARLLIDSSCIKVHRTAGGANVCPAQVLIASQFTPLGPQSAVPGEPLGSRGPVLIPAAITMNFPADRRWRTPQTARNLSERGTHSKPPRDLFTLRQGQREL